MSKNKTAKQILIFGWLILLIIGGLLAWFWKTLPPQLPWFYSLPGGEQQLVNKMILAGVVAGMGLFLGLTRLLSSWAGKGDNPVETTLMAGGFVAILLLAASFIRVLQIFAL